MKEPTNRDTIHQAGAEDQLLWGLARLGRMRFWFWATRVDARLMTSVYVLISSFVCMAILGGAAMLSSWQLIFPSLGPTIFLQFYAPSLASSSPRNTVAGHLIGVTTGILFFLAGKMVHCGHEGLCAGQVFMAAAALGTSGSIMAFTGLVHPPAASTTLIAALGLVERWQDVAVVAVSALLISMVAWVLHRFSGVRFPLWYPLNGDEGPVLETKLGHLHVSKGPARQARPGPFASGSSKCGTAGDLDDRASEIAARLRSRQPPSPRD